jgi:flagellar biosynthesis/type III secretory pathway protein FliH
MPTIAQQWVEQGKAIGEKQGWEKGRQQGRQEGRKQGRQQGERKATLKALHQTLTIRFDVVLGEFDKHFESLDLKSLEQLNEIALTVQTLAEFEKVLADMISKIDVTSPRSDNSE